MPSINEIIEFVKHSTGSDNISADTDIFEDGTSGDDFHELMESFAKTYSVDMSTYLWYFHADEEGNNIGGFFFKPPYQRVKRIRVTPELLTEFANKQKWDIEYPDHAIPKKRFDILINQLLFAGLILWLIVFFIKKC